MFRSSLALGVMAAGLISFAAQAETVKYHAKLDAAQEVPPKESKASGEFSGTLDTATKVLSYKISYSGLTGPATMAHFHGPAAPGANAGVEVVIPNIAPSTTGSVTLTDAQMADLKAGKLYVNVHTAANPGGEIRGQVVQ